MKTTNQFDYPTATATNYKAYRQQPPPQPDQSKLHYKQVIKQESLNERDRVKQEQLRKKDQQKIEQQKRIREEIEKKKQELEDLERRRQQAVEHERRAAELAKIKDEQDKIRRIEQQQRAKEADQNANFRFKDALRRLEAQKEEYSFKERQAQHRRKVNQQIEKEERQKASKFKSYLVQKEQEDKAKALDDERRREQLFRQGMGKHGLAKNVDFSKTCFHNPKMIFSHQDQQQVTAIERGQAEQKRQRELLSQRREREQQNRQRSLERQNKALEKIDRNREYSAYCKQTEQQQIQYNLDRIEAGKKNQFTGLKPLTLGQMQDNKKIRSQKEFQDMFVQNPSSMLQSRPINNYRVVEEHFTPTSTYQQWKDQRSSELQMNESKTGGMYSYHHDHFDDHQEDDMEQRQIEVVPQPILIEPTAKRPMAETRADERKPQKEELSYSQSEEDSEI